MLMGFPGGSVVKNPPANAEDSSSIPGLGRSPGERNGNPLQDSCLRIPMDRGAWRDIVQGVAKTEQQQQQGRFQPCFPGTSALTGVSLSCLSELSGLLTYDVLCLAHKKLWFGEVNLLIHQPTAPKCTDVKVKLLHPV